jgi:hypothetical protein
VTDLNMAIRQKIVCPVIAVDQLVAIFVYVSEHST